MFTLPTLLLLAAAPPSPAIGCELSAPARRMYSEIKLKEIVRDLTEDEQKGRSDALGAVAAANPNDLRAQDQLVGWLTGRDRIEAAIPRYREAAASGAPEAMFLYASLIRWWQGIEAKDLLEKALAKAPNLAPAHQLLAELYVRHPKLKSRPTAIKHAQAFMQLCPEALAAYEQMKDIAPAAELAALAPRLRSKLESWTDVERMEGYATLWGLEFAAAKVADHDAVRARVARDLERLVKLEPTLEVLSTISGGYDLTKNEVEAKKTNEAIYARYPRSWAGGGTVSEQTKVEAERPGDDAPPDKRLKYWNELREVSARGMKAFPNELSPALKAVWAAQNLDEMPAAEVKAAAELALQLSGRMAVANRRSTVPFSVAKAYLRHGIELAAIPGLLEQAAPLAELEDRHRPSDWDDADRVWWRAYSRLSNQWFPKRIMFERAMKLKDLKGARASLADLEELLKANSPAAGADGKDVDPHADRARAVALFQGRLLREEGKKLDALAAYQRGLFARDGEHYDSYGREDQEALKAESSALWGALGGSPAAYATWITPPVGAGDSKTLLGHWEPKNSAVPAFQLEDLSGKKWGLKDLKGKVTYATVWATWCGPCKAELPFVKKLADKLKGRADVQVISLNADEDLGLVQPFAQKQGLNFPVIPARTLVEDLVPSFAIPRSWIIGRDGKLLYEFVGFAAAEAWVDKTAATLDEVASAKR